MIPVARTDPWQCRTCGGVHELATRSLEVGLVRLAVHGEAGFRLGSEGIETHVAPLLAPCSCGGRLTPEYSGPGTKYSPESVYAAFDAGALLPFAERGWALLDRSTDPRLERLATLWRPRALRLLGRDADLTREQQLELRLEQRLTNLQAEIERARGAGDDEAAQAAHARYIELGTTFVRRFVLIENGRPGTAD
jgi:hypothetical protein